MTLNDLTLQDPKDRDGTSRLTVGSVQADVTLASLWSGSPQVTELLVVRPVLLRAAAARTHRCRRTPRRSRRRRRARQRQCAAIDRVTINDGAIVFSNLRDRVENRLDGINAEMRIGGDRKIKLNGAARAGDKPLKFDIRATAPTPPLERQNIPVEFTLDAPGIAAGAAVGQGRGPAQRLDRHDQRPHRHARRRRVQRLGLGRSRPASRW